MNRQDRIKRLERQLERDLHRYDSALAADDHRQANNWYKGAAATASILTALRGDPRPSSVIVNRIPEITTWEGKPLHELTGEEAKDMVTQLWPRENAVVETGESQTEEGGNLLPTEGEQRFTAESRPHDIEAWFKQLGEKLAKKCGPGRIETEQAQGVALTYKWRWVPD